MRFIYLLILLMMSAAVLADVDYFIDPDSSDGLDGLSEENAFNELDDVPWTDVHNAIISGEDVYIRLKGGKEYPVPDGGWNLFAGGTVNNRIYIIGYDGMPTINCRNTLCMYFRQHTVGRNSGYITFDGIEMKDGKQPFYNGSRRGIHVKGCKIHDMRLRCVLITSDSIVGGSPEDGNEIYNCGAGTAGSDVAVVGQNNIISHNHLYATPDRNLGLITDRGIDGIVMERASNLLIEYNTIHGPSVPPAYSGYNPFHWLVPEVESR